MRRPLLLLVLTAAASWAADRAPVDAMLDDWHDAAAKADEKRYFAHFTEDAVFLGSDATERWTKPEFQKWAKPFFDKGKAWTLKPRDRFVIFAKDGETAWFDEAADSPAYGACRGSGVAVRQDGRWKVAQYNFSVPVPNALMDRVVKMIREESKPPVKQ